jgi:hypothetical protein
MDEGRAMGGRLRVGKRVRLRVDAVSYRSGETGRVAFVERGPGDEAPLYLCEMGPAGRYCYGACYPDEVERLD